MTEKNEQHIDAIRTHLGELFAILGQIKTLEDDENFRAAVKKIKTALDELNDEKA